MATTSAQCLEKDTQRGRLIDTIFAQKLIKGTASLFRYKDKSGFIYYLLEKNNVLKDLPPRNCYTRIDSGGMRTVQDKLRSNVNTSTNFTVYTYIKDDYLDTLGIMLNDKRYITNPTSMYSYTEKNLSYYVRQYNKDIGEPNGGMLKNKISRKIFTGISLGPVNMIYDEDIAKADLAGSYAIKLYGLYPLLGVNKSLYAKFGFNYMTYRNDIYKKSIASASFGLRQVLDKTYIRPYFEGAISLASLNKNNRPIDIGFPLLLEAGVIVPIKNLFLTLSASHTPVVVYKLIGYKLWSFNVGVMF